MSRARLRDGCVDIDMQMSRPRMSRRMAERSCEECTSSLWSMATSPPRYVRDAVAACCLLMNQGAAQLQDKLESILKPRPLTPAERSGSRSLIISPGSSFVHSTSHPNPAEINNAVIYHLYLGDVTDYKLRATIQLFDQIADEPAFDQLRTKEQLGYIVQSSITQKTGELGWKVLIQSERDPVHVELRIEAFIEGLKEYIGNMSEEQFEKQRQSLISKREEKPKNLGEETKRFWGRVQDQYYEFGRREFCLFEWEYRADDFRSKRDRVPQKGHKAGRP